MTEQTMTSKCIKLSNGSECWFLGKKLHRTDGPAFYRPGTDFKSFYLHGKFYSFEEWIDAVTEQITPRQKTMLLLKYSDQLK